MNNLTAVSYSPLRSRSASMIGRFENLSETLLLVGTLVVYAIILRLTLAYIGQPIIEAEEAHLGLRAARLIRDRNPLGFFTDEEFGFSFFENICAAAGFAVFGASDLALRFSMFGVWLLGLVFFALALDKIGGGAAAWSGALLLASIPLWGQWSMQGGRGYQVCFLAAGLLLWRLAVFHAAGGRRQAASLTGAGLAAALLLWADPLWFVAVAPFAAVVFFVPGRLLNSAVLLFSFSLAFAALSGFSLTGLPHWDAAAIINSSAVEQSAEDLLENLLRVLTGADQIYAASKITFIAACSWLALLLTAMAVELIRTLRGAARSNVWRIAATWSIFAGLCAYLFVSRGAYEPRYFLPLVCTFTVLAAMNFCSLYRMRGFSKVLAVSCLGALLVLNQAALAAQKAVSRYGEVSGSGKDKQPAEILIDYLLQHGYRTVYTIDAALKWTILWQSRGRLPVKSLAQALEDPARTADSISDQPPIALVAGAGEVDLHSEVIRRALKDKAANILAYRFFLWPDPPAEALRELAGQK